MSGCIHLPELAIPAIAVRVEFGRIISCLLQLNTQYPARVYNSLHSQGRYPLKKVIWIRYRLAKIKAWVDENDPRGVIIPWSAKLESALMEMEPDEAGDYLKEKSTTSALDKIITNGFKALHLEYFFTAGPDEVKAWTIKVIDPNTVLSFALDTCKTLLCPQTRLIQKAAWTCGYVNMSGILAHNISDCLRTAADLLELQKGKRKR